MVNLLVDTNALLSPYIKEVVCHTVHNTGTQYRR